MRLAQLFLRLRKEKPKSYLCPLQMQEARNHHFVPKFLLRPWLREEPARHFNLWGYYWKYKQGGLACKRRGLDSFCSQLDLLSLRAHHLGRDAIERVFFGEVDTKGSIARAALLERDPTALTEERRADFARLLMSLEARRPTTVKKLRIEGAQMFAAKLDDDPELLAALADHGINERPSVFYERTSHAALEDRAVMIIQGLTDNSKVGKQLINAHWHLIRLGPADGSLVLADRPLIRFDAFDAPGAVWLLPLTPKVAFLAANRPENLKKICLLSNFQFCRNANISSALQAERYVFSVEPRDSNWLGKYLGPRRGR